MLTMVDNSAASGFQQNFNHQAKTWGIMQLPLRANRMMPNLKKHG